MEQRKPPYIEKVEILDSSGESGTHISSAQRSLRHAELAYYRASCTDLQEIKEARAEAVAAAQFFSERLKEAPNSKDSSSLDALLNFSLFYMSEFDHRTNECAIKSGMPMKRGAKSNDDKKNEGGGQNEEMSLREKIEGAILRPKCGAFGSFKEYAGGAEYEKLFQDLAVIPFRYSNFASKEMQAVLLFGPPGTGKSKLAEAVAEAISGLFISISASDIKGKYVGESEKAVKMLFTVAREQAMATGKLRPVIIFIDEIDGVISKEDSSTGLLSELNKQIQGVSDASNAGLIALVSTNYPSELPAAALSRFQDAKVYIGLPSADVCKEVIYHRLASMPSTFRYAGAQAGYIIIPEKISGSMVGVNPLGTMLIPSKNNGADASYVDMLAQYFEDNSYSVRDIHSFFRVLKRLCARDARDFSMGDADWVSKDGYFYLSWLLDRTLFTRKQENADGQCSDISEARHVLVPLSVEFPNEANQGGGQDPKYLDESYIYGTAAPQLISNKKKDADNKRPAKPTSIIRVMTRSKWDKDGKVLPTTFYKQFVYDDDAWETGGEKGQWVPYNDDADTTVNLDRLLGHCQMLPKYVEMALGSTNSSPIDKIDGLISFIRAGGTVYAPGDPEGQYDPKGYAIHLLERARDKHASQ